MPTTGSTPLPASDPATILIVEDERIVANDLADILAEQGYRVAGIVSTGEEAIQQANLIHPDIILMDIMLRGPMNGIKASEIIQQQLGCPVIFLTAYADQATLKQAKQTAPYGYLVKPIDVQTLRVMLEVALQRHHCDQAQQGWYQKQIQASQARLEQLIHFDPLTHLPNRSYLQQQFERQLQLETVAPSGDNIAWTKSCFPLFCFSLDRFDRLNDQLGYEGCDRLLQLLAERLTAACQQQEVIACTERNEFAVLPTALGSLEGVPDLAQTLLELITQPFQLDHQEIFLTASLGIALYPQDGSHLEILLQRCRRTMLHLQQKGGNACQFYSSRLTNPSRQLGLETDLHYALERQELMLHYQPQVDLLTGKVIGAETLLRWRHPERGPVSPVEFIPIAEVTGLIVPIGYWVLETACQQLQSWQAAGLPPLRLAINLSGYQLHQPDLCTRLATILSCIGLEPETLELELTESILVNSDVNVALAEIKALGCQVAIDDFGTGYASLSYLQQFAFDILKLDRSFVQNVDTNSRNAAIATAVITLAHELNLQIVAEGVETEGELAFLHQIGCDRLQGYLFSPPLAADDFAALILEEKQLVRPGSSSPTPTGK